MVTLGEVETIWYGLALDPCPNSDVGGGIGAVKVMGVLLTPDADVSPATGWLTPNAESISVTVPVAAVVLALTMTCWTALFATRSR